MGVLAEGCEQYLDDAYRNFYNSPDSCLKYDLASLRECGEGFEQEMIRHLEILKNGGYITLEISDTEAKTKITQKGLNYYEPKQNSGSITFNQGNNANTIFIENSGSLNNSLNGNNLNINLQKALQEIDNSDLDEENKRCLHSFVSELESVPQESRFQKVKDFVGKISSGVIQASIPSLMTFFLSHYLHL